MKRCFYCGEKFKPKENENFCCWEHQTYWELGNKKMGGIK